MPVCDVAFVESQSLGTEVDGTQVTQASGQIILKTDGPKCK